MAQYPSISIDIHDGCGSLGKTKAVGIVPQPGGAGKRPLRALLRDLFGTSEPDFRLLREPGAFPGHIHGWQSCSSPLSQEWQRGGRQGYLPWISHSWIKQSPEWRIPCPELGRAPGSRPVPRLHPEQLLPYLPLCTRNSFSSSLSFVLPSVLRSLRSRNCAP